VSERETAAIKWWDELLKPPNSDTTLSWNCNSVASK
jgi:hypothetical protein